MKQLFKYECKEVSNKLMKVIITDLVHGEILEVDTDISHVSKKLLPDVLAMFESPMEELSYGLYGDTITSDLVQDIFKDAVKASKQQSKEK